MSKFQIRHKYNVEVFRPYNGISSHLFMFPCFSSSGIVEVPTKRILQLRNQRQMCNTVRSRNARRNREGMPR